MAWKQGKQSESTPISHHFKYHSNSNYNIKTDKECLHDLNQNNDESSQQLFKFSRISRSKKYVLVLCTVTNFLSAAAISILGPFYTAEAHAKGMDLTMIGLVFSMYQLVVFLTSSIIGTFMTRIGIKFVYISGVYVGGCCTILFGFLDKGPDGIPFMVMSIVIRSVEALGFAGFNTASMAVVSNEFPDHVGSVMALQKAGTGFGNMVGPVIAGFLYELGGYGLPFYFIGILTIFSDVAIYKYLPDQTIDEKETVNTGSIFDLLRNPLIILAMVVVCHSAGEAYLYISTLAELVKDYDISETVVGAIFGSSALVFMIMTFIAGYLTDKKDQQALLIIFGHFVCCLFWLINGPSFLLPFIPLSLWVTFLDTCLFGVGYGCLIVPSINCMVKGAMELKYEQNQHTFGLISGLYNSAFALGGFAGPVSGGAMIQRYGFPNGYTIIGLINLLMFFVAIGFFSLRRLLRQNKNNNLNEAMHLK